MDKQKIYRKIYDMARQLQKDSAIYTRADVAYELRDFGVEKDSFDVEKLVWETYEHFNEDAVIGQAFYDNEKKRPLVSGGRLDHLMETADDNALFPLLQHELERGGGSLQVLERAVTQVMDGAVLAKAGQDVLGTVVGTQGVSKVRNEATAVFNGYSGLVGRYDDAKGQVKYLMADFVKLRTRICDAYRRYAMTLTDAFGDSIKAVEPRLFDFDSVEWLDVQGMLQQVKLDYDRITEKCSVLMSDISDSFSQSLNAASNSYRSAGSKKAGLMLAALNMVSHYADAAQKTTEMKQELLLLKNSVKHDVTLVKGDLGRLVVIYKTLNDLYIPQSEVFCRFSNQVFTTEWQKLTDMLYAGAQAKAMKQHRDELLDEVKELEKDMADEEMNISYYTSHIDECKQLLGSLRDQYLQAKGSKPSRPSALANLFSFGTAKTKYNRNLYEWNQACKPVISRFDDLQVDVKLDTDELNQLQSDLEKNRRRHRELKQELEQSNRKLAGILQANPSLRAAMLPHLEAVIKLLRMGREIAESKLDRKLVQTVSVTRQDTALPAEVSRNLDALAQAVREQAYVDGDTVRRVMDQPAESMQAQDVPAERLTDSDVEQLTAAGNAALQGTVDLLQAWGRLQAMRAQSAIAHKAYDEELAKLQDEFRRNLSDIDDKAAVLRESMRRMNTAENYDQLKEGLLSLVGKDNVFTEDDWKQFLDGKKAIIL